MSYDFACFKLVAGTDPQTVCEQVLDEEFSDATPLDPEVEATKDRVARSLVKIYPELQRLVMNYAMVAQNHGISEEAARRRFRFVELDNDEYGVQIIISDNHVSVTIPYWHQGAKAERAFRMLWGCLATIEKETGYTTYDPQLERVINPPADRDAATRRYLDVSENLEQIVGATAAPQTKRPWWKFW